MMDMRPEDFEEKKPKGEYDFQKAVNALEGMTLEQLDALIGTVQDLLEMKKTEQRRNEIIAELNDLFAELIEMDCCLFFNTGKGYPVEIEGSVSEQGAGQIYID